MPKVAYSEAERQRIRTALISVGLELMAKQGIQHTTVEQIYQAVGISRTFFYSFFPTKEDLVVETLYLQQPVSLHIFARSCLIQHSAGGRRLSSFSMPAAMARNMESLF